MVNISANNNNKEMTTFDPVPQALKLQEGLLIQPLRFKLLDHSRQIDTLNFAPTFMPNINYSKPLFG